jgi:hypothetical protein
MDNFFNYSNSNFHRNDDTEGVFCIRSSNLCPIKCTNEDWYKTCTPVGGLGSKCDLGGGICRDPKNNILFGVCPPKKCTNENWFQVCERGERCNLATGTCYKK